MTTLSDFSSRTAEVGAKLQRLRASMAEHKIDVLTLRQTANIAWLTAGASTFINEATDTSPVFLVISADKAIAVTDTIETPRLHDDEGFEKLGYEFFVEKWYDRGRRGPMEFDFGVQVGQDGSGDGVNFEATVQDLRLNLMPEEIARLREGARLAAAALDEAIRAVRPGDSEYLLAARLAAAARARGGQPIVNLIASDERIYQFRHPLPTAKTVEKYAMLVLCFRYGGLISSVTRLVHFGPLSDELRAKMNTVARVDARLILGTQPGRTLSQMFEIARQAYASEGYPAAIEEHHQGGSAAYQPREYLATPGTQAQVAVNQAYAWNPSVRGCKSEDTVVITPDGPEVLTVIPGWPVTKVEGGPEGGTIERPEILVL